MEQIIPDEILDASGAAHRTAKFNVGSLWWFSEQVWRSASPALGSAWESGSRSHPGTFVNQTHPDGSPRVMIHAGRTPVPKHEHSSDIVVEMRPRECPQRMTKFAGKGGFIGQVRLSRLLKGEIPWDSHRPATQNWLHPNSELKSLNEDDLTKLVQWRTTIFTQLNNA